MVDLLMFSNCVFSVRNVEIWAVLSSNEVDLLLLRNRVFMVRNAEKWAVLFTMRPICWCSGIAYSGCESFKNGECFPDSVLFADGQEWLIHFAKYSNVGIFAMKELQFAGSQESSFQASNFEKFTVPSRKV